MRILLVNHTARAHTGGLNRMVVETCGLLVSARHSVALAFNDGGASEVACPTFALPADDAPDAAMRAAFEDVLQKFQPEVVQLHGADHAFFARKSRGACQRAGSFTIKVCSARAAIG